MNRRNFIKAVAGLCVALKTPFFPKTKKIESKRFRQILVFSRGEEAFSIEDDHLLSIKQEGCCIEYKFDQISIHQAGIMTEMKLLNYEGNIILQRDHYVPVVSGDFIQSHYYCH